MSDYADVAILKWQPVGGFEAAHRLAQTINLPVVISSALETGIGISHGLALAASFEHQSLACGLGTVALFESDICSPAVLAHDGFLEVARREPVVDERYLASSERVEYWKNRIVRVLEIIERSEE
jgi:O-succinylbenzoate synthase